MQAEIITIGDEILVGQTLDTNSNWIAQQMNLLGIPIYQNTTIKDTREHILSALETAYKRSELIFITGGLGPTKDDITKETLCEFFNTTLEKNEEVLEMIESYFKSKGREMLETNIQQAYLPKGCKVIKNYLGTASGMWFEKEGKIVVSMPGVPYEMKGLMEQEIIPEIEAFFDISKVYHFTVKTQGIGESFLAEKIKDWEDEIRGKGMGLAYLPSPGQVKLRISSYFGGEEIPFIQKKAEELRKRLPKYVYGSEKNTIHEVVGKLLEQEKATLSTVESCTGGYLSHLITSVPGSSNYYMGSLITYSNEMKIKYAQVSVKTLKEHGAVSEETVTEMAIGGCAALGTDACIATSGIAGPDGGTPSKPVGTIWIATAYKGKVMARKFQMGTHRLRNIEISALTGLNMLRNLILDQEF